MTALQVAFITSHDELGMELAMALELDLEPGSGDPGSGAGTEHGPAARANDSKKAVAMFLSDSVDVRSLRQNFTCAHCAAAQPAEKAAVLLARSSRTNISKPH